MGPTQQLVFLGIKINTITESLSLPADKLIRLKALLKQWHDRKAVQKTELLSLLGHLSHAAMVIQPGRVFVRHLIDAAKQAHACSSSLHTFE